MKYLSDKESWSKGGIYKISSTESCKSYFGQTICFRNRFNQHKSLLKSGKNPSIILQRFCDKHGLDSLTFEVIEICEKKILNEREFYFLNNYECELNLSKNPEKIRYGIKHTKESKDRMVRTRVLNGSYKISSEIAKKIHAGNKYNLGKKHSEETKRKIGEKSKGRIWSKEAKEKLSKSLTGRKMSDEFKEMASKRMIGNKNGLGVVFSKERIDKIRDSVSKKVLMISMDNKELQIFNSTKEAAKFLGSDNYRNISTVCKGNRISSLGYKWKYYE